MNTDFLYVEPASFNIGETVVVSRLVRLTARIDRTKWEDVQHDCEDAEFYQVATIIAVNEHGFPTHFDVSGGMCEAGMSSSISNLRVRETFKIQDDFASAARKVAGSVFSTRSGLVDNVVSIKGGGNPSVHPEKIA